MNLNQNCNLLQMLAIKFQKDLLSILEILSLIFFFFFASAALLLMIIMYGF
jgi:hypothetical protein